MSLIWYCVEQLLFAVDFIWLVVFLWDSLLFSLGHKIVCTVTEQGSPYLDWVPPGRGLWVLQSCEQSWNNPVLHWDCFLICQTSQREVAEARTLAAKLHLGAIHQDNAVRRTDTDLTLKVSRIAINLQNYWCHHFCLHPTYIAKKN